MCITATKNTQAKRWSDTFNNKLTLIWYKTAEDDVGDLFAL